MFQFWVGQFGLIAGDILWLEHGGQVLLLRLHVGVRFISAVVLM